MIEVKTNPAKRTERAAAAEEVEVSEQQTTEQSDNISSISSCSEAVLFVFCFEIDRLQFVFRYLVMAFTKFWQLLVKTLYFFVQPVTNIWASA
uniref:Uncharacterized protein n=1 Tax=Amphimedon queenslandica TaxID=400682 RepID=A0A1X7TNQ2_AMPQE